MSRATIDYMSSPRSHNNNRRIFFSSCKNYMQSLSTIRHNIDRLFLLQIFILSDSISCFCCSDSDSARLKRAYLTSVSFQQEVTCGTVSTVWSWRYRQRALPRYPIAAPPSRHKRQVQQNQMNGFIYFPFIHAIVCPSLFGSGQ